MHAHTEASSRPTMTRHIRRGLAATVVGAVLIAGLAACATGRDAVTETQVRTLPAGVAGPPADRVAQAFGETIVVPPAARSHVAGPPADRVAQAFGETVAVPMAARSTSVAGPPADRVAQAHGETIDVRQESRSTAVAGPPADRLDDLVE